MSDIFKPGDRPALYIPPSGEDEWLSKEDRLLALAPFRERATITPKEAKLLVDLIVDLLVVEHPIVGQELVVARRLVAAMFLVHQTCWT